MENISSTTNLALDLMLNNKSKSGRGECGRGKEHCTDYIFNYENNKQLKIPYDAYKMLEMAKDLIFMANSCINEDKNVGE